jgi:hypothetical protein
MPSNQNSIQNKKHNKSRLFLAAFVRVASWDFAALGMHMRTLCHEYSQVPQCHQTLSEVLCSEWQCLLLFLFCFVLFYTHEFLCSSRNTGLITEVKDFTHFPTIILQHVSIKLITPLEWIVIEYVVFRFPV